MKILISSDTYYPHVNGASYFTQRLAEYLYKAGHTVVVIAPAEVFKNTLTVRDGGVQVYGIKSFPIFFYPKFRGVLPFGNKKYLQKILTEFNPDIIHIQGHFSISRDLLAVNDNKVKVIATNHFMPENLLHYAHLPLWIENKIKKMMWNDLAKVFKGVSKVTTPTQTAANLIQENIPHIIEAVSCGIDLDRFKPENNGDYLRDKYKLHNTPVLLYVGRLDKEKNIDFIIKSFAKVANNIDCLFVIAGNGAEKKNLQELVKICNLKNRVTFAGFVPNDDLPNLYAVASCFINAGTAELQSIVTMEAMATGLPILAVNAVALPELVRDGENGFLFEDQNQKDLSEKLVRIFTDTSLREQMGKMSLEIIKKHDIKRSISRFENIYRNTN